MNLNWQKTLLETSAMITMMACNGNPAQPQIPLADQHDNHVERHLPCDPVETFKADLGVPFRDCGYCHIYSDSSDPSCAAVPLACLDDAWQRCLPAHLTLDESGIDTTWRVDVLVVPSADMSGCELVSFEDTRTDEHSSHSVIRSFNEGLIIGPDGIWGDGRGGSEVLGSCDDGYGDCEVCDGRRGWPELCRRDPECQADQACAAVQRCPCDDLACPDGRLCRDGVCVDCSTDLACTDGRFCLESGFCACTDDAQCPTFHPRCLDGRCVGCAEDGDCAPDGRCQEPNTCIANPRGGSREGR